jgi:hypothetical protein
MGAWRLVLSEHGVWASAALKIERPLERELEHKLERELERKLERA